MRHKLAMGFPIPMRGNELAAVSGQWIGLLVPNPHEG